MLLLRPAAYSSNYCNSIKIDNGNLTYCGIEKEWTSHHEGSSAIAACIVLGILSFSATGIAAWYGNKEDRAWILTVKLIVDAIDVILDVYTYYQLDYGELIDPTIYRNPHVINGILVFAIFGALKSMFVAYMFVCRRNLNGFLVGFMYEDLAAREQYDDYVELNSVYMTYVFEDCFEMFLEYFWIEKYFTYSPPIYMVIKDVVMMGIPAYGIFKLVKTKMLGINFNIYEIWWDSLLIILLIVELLRAIGAIYQYERKVFNRNCLSVAHGKLVQTPFNSNCLHDIDYAIICLAFFLYLPLSVRLFFAFLSRLRQ